MVDKAESVTAGTLAVIQPDTRKRKQSPAVAQKTSLKLPKAIWRKVQILAIDTTREVQEIVATVVAEYVNCAGPYGDARDRMHT